MTATPTSTDPQPDPQAPELGANCAEVMSIVREAAHGGHMDRFRSELAVMSSVLLNPEHPAQDYLSNNLTGPMRSALRDHWASRAHWYEPVPEVRHLGWLIWEVDGASLKLRVGRLQWALLLEHEARLLFEVSGGLFGAGMMEEIAEAHSLGLSLWPQMSKVNERWAAFRATGSPAVDLAAHRGLTDRRLRQVLAEVAMIQVVDHPNLAERS